MHFIFNVLCFDRFVKENAKPYFSIKSLIFSYASFLPPQRLWEHGSVSRYSPREHIWVSNAFFGCLYLDNQDDPQMKPHLYNLPSYSPIFFLDYEMLLCFFFFNRKMLLCFANYFYVLP